MNRHTETTRNPRAGASALIAAMLGVVLGAGLGVESAAGQPAVATDTHELVVPGGAQHIYIMTDKPMYRPGETLWFRAWDVRVKDFAAAPAVQAMNFKLVDPKGATVAEKRVQVRAGVAANDVVLGADLVGGRYLLQARSDAGESAERTIVVSTYELPRFKKKLSFPRASYAPGERVSAELSLSRATGEPLARARATAVVWIDGAEVTRRTVRADREGNATISFELPGRMAKGDGLLTVTVEHSGINESIQRRIPIAVQAVEVDVFAEGGDLVAGLPARVYVAARDPFAEPVDVRGAVVDSQGKRVSEFRTDLRGMGRFDFQPAAGQRYQIVLDSPESVRGKVVAMPRILDSGCTLRSQDDFRSEAPDLVVEVACTGERAVMVTAVLRESLVARVDSQVAASAPATVRLPVPAERQGAVRVTVFSREDRKPLAERLVYRGLGRDVRVSIRPDRESYAPRDRVTLAIETRDPSGKSVPAEVAIAVVDDTVLDLADDKSAHILASLYLMPEMPGQRIDDPDFYFSDHADAPRAMDLLLGTKGWRRFNWQWRPLAR